MSDINEAPAVAKEGDIFIPSGNLGIKRKDMPQIDPSAQEAFFKQLREKGVRITKERIKSADLTPTQAEINGNKVASMVKAAGTNPDFFGKEPIMVSGDNYVLDGHHRWLASLNIDPDYVQTVWKIHMPIKALLKFSTDEFKEVAFRDIREAVAAFTSMQLNEHMDTAMTLGRALAGGRTRSGKTIPALDEAEYESITPEMLSACFEGWTADDHLDAAQHWRSASGAVNVPTLLTEAANTANCVPLASTLSACSRVASLHERAIVCVDEATSEALGVPEQHQFKIAKRTLRMNDVGARIMGGMSKEEARKFLKTKAGWPDAKIKAYEDSDKVSEARPKPKMGKGIRPLNVPDNDDDDNGVSAEDVRECPACGTENAPMGALGRRQHYRCRGCGMMYSHDASKNESVVNEGPGVDPKKWFGKQARTLQSIGSKLEQQGVSTEYSDRELYVSGDEYDIRVYYVGSSASNGERASAMVMKITDPNGKTQFYGGWSSTKGNKSWEDGLAKFKELTGVAFPEKGTFHSGGGAFSGGRIKASTDFMGMFENDITDRIGSLLGEGMLHGRNVDKVLQSYMGTALWSSTDNSSSNGGEPLDRNFDISDISPKVKARMKQDVERFIRETADINSDDWDDEQFGHDFWLSRNGHGAGFWDFYDHRATDEQRKAGDALHKVAKKFGNFDLFVVKFQSEEHPDDDFDPEDDTVYAHQVAESNAPRARGSLQGPAYLTTRSDFATLSQSHGRTTMLTEAAVENAELSAAAETIKAHANKLLPFVSGGVKVSIGVPVLYLSLSTVTRDKWVNGIFENGPTMRVGITNDSERPVGAVSLTANEQPASGTTRDRGATYSVDFNVHGRYSPANGDTLAKFKPRAMNRKPLDKIVAYVNKVITQFAATAPSGPKNESRGSRDEAGGGGWAVYVKYTGDGDGPYDVVSRHPTQADAEQRLKREISQRKLKHPDTFEDAWVAKHPDANESATEYVIWGIAPGTDDEQILFASVKGEPVTSKAVAVKLQELAEKKGATEVRIQTVDMRTPPDFRKGLREVTEPVDESVADAETLLSMIKAGTRVTIRVPNGIGRDGPEWKEKTGKAVMPSRDGGWVLNMGGQYGTPGIANANSIVAVGKTRRADESVDEALPSGVKVIKIKSLTGGAVQHQVVVDGRSIGDFYTGRDSGGVYYTNHTDMNGKAVRAGEVIRDRDAMIQAMIKYDKEQAAKDFAKAKASPNRVEMRGDIVSGVYVGGKPVTDHGIKIANKADIRRGALFDLEDKYNTEFVIVSESVDEAATENPFKVGDILYSSWGYDQTNVDFYRVEKVSGSTVTVIQLESEEKSDKDPGTNTWAMTGTVVPTNRTKGTAFRRKVQTTGSEPGIRIESFAGAYKWDGKPKQVSHYA